MNSEMRTNMLIYNISGKMCPAKTLLQGCKLRQTLYQLQQNLKIGYRVLENGILLAPCFFATGNDSTDKLHNLKDIETDICADCYKKNRQKESQKTDAREKPQIQTVILGYKLCSVNCPAGMTKATCPLRKEFTNTEEKFNVGYRPLNENTLLFPEKHHDSKTNVFHDMWQRQAEICDKCFEQNQQKTK